MRNILVLCYQLSPTKGSEYSVAWNYVKNMSRNNRLTVIYGVSGQHMGDITEMQEYSRTHDMPNVRFVPILPNRLARCLNFLNVKGVFAYSFYLAYAVWHRQVFQTVKQLVRGEHFDLVHYLNPIGYREPGHVWKLGIPYMWGPINGMGNYPSVMFDFQPASFRLKYAFRALANKLQLHLSVRVREAINRADKLLVATTENADICKRIFHKVPSYLPENCLTAPANLNEDKFRDIDREIRLVAAGCLDGRKNFLTILKALHYMQSPDRFHLDLIGDGPLRSQLERYASENGLSKYVTFHGQIPRDEVMPIFNNAHLHVITSIGEGNPTTIWEAMSYGVPTMTVDHCGMHDTVTDDDGYKVKVSTSDNVAREMAKQLDEIASCPQQLITKARTVVEHSKSYQWDRRVDFFEHCYDECIENYNKKNCD